MPMRLNDFRRKATKEQRQKRTVQYVDTKYPQSSRIADEKLESKLKKNRQRNISS